MKSQFTRFFAKGPIAAIVLLTGVLALIAGVSNKPETPQPAASGGKSPFIRSLTERRIAQLSPSFLDASVTTDQQDYSPGEIVQISGSGFMPGESVALQVTYITTSVKTARSSLMADASGHDPWMVTADQNGNITSSWLVENDSLGQTLLLTADGQSSGLHAEHVFTDNIGRDFSQCKNNAGGALALGECGWIHGILQQNNSRYFEGMSTLQRLVIDSIPATSGNNHSFGFHDDFTKAGLHAYDFLTSWEQGIKAGADNGVPYIDLQPHTPVAGELASINQTLTAARACDENIGGTAQTICLALHGSANHFDVPVPDDAFVSHDGSTQSRINAYETAYGQRYIRIYGDQPITSASFTSNVHDVGNGADTGDSIVSYTLVWQSASTNILLEWGEHIAFGGDGTGIGWGAGKGASSISGGPYHVSQDSVDGSSTGASDNQLKGADVLPPPPQGTLTIVKDSIPDDPQDFNFTADNGLTPASFILDDDGGSDSTHSNTQTFTSVANGTYHVTEGTEPAGWSLAKITCTDPNGGTTTSINAGGNGGTATIGVSAGESITCTFTNVKPDAKISLTPASATNEVGHAHTITATVQQNDQLPIGAPGDGAAGFGPAPDGTLVTFSVTSGSATFVGGVNTCTTTGGSCSVQINSTGAGVNTIHATTTFSVLGVSLTRATGDSNAGDGADVKKTYVDAKISLSPLTATNEVGHAHTITATVQQDDGIPAGAPGDGVTGFGPAPDGTTVTFSITSGSATFVGGVNFCTTTGGSCSVQINSTGAGGNTIHATTTFSVGGVSLTRATGDGLSGDGTNVTKTYVDAKIVLSPLTATNNVNQNHVITATVSQDDGIANPGGDGSNGFGPAPNGTTVNFSITNSLGATATFVGSSSCTTSGGICTVTIVSPTAGHVVIHATTTFSVGGVSLTRASGDSNTGDSVDAQKDYVSASLTLVKVVINDDGGTATASSFGISSDAGTFTFLTAPVQNPTGTFTYTSNTLSNLAPGTKSLHENTLAGYTEGTWGCTGGTGTVVGNPQTGSVVLNASENVTCTITNNDNTPTLKLVKNVVNDDGGTAVAHDYTLSANAAGNPLTRNFSDVGDSTTFHNVSGGSSYALGESPNPGAGYSTTGVWVCTGNGTAMPDTSHVIVGIGEAVTCTITNTDNPPTLKLVKSVVNDDGGTAVPHDYTLFAAAAGNPLTRNFSDFGDSTTFHNVNNGSSYALSESPNPGAGYSSDGIWVCTGNGTAMPDTSHVIVKLGEAVTCTITNTDNPPTLKLVKSVVNDDGGTATPHDYTLSAIAAGNPLSRNFSDLGDSTTFHNVNNLSSYALSESPNPGAGYSTTGVWVCTGNSTAMPDTSHVIVKLGEAVTCTITNTDNAPTLKLVKNVVNNDGGTAQPHDYTLTAAAAGNPLSRNFSDLGDSATFHNVNNGSSYALSESPNPGAGYSSDGIWVCTGNSTTMPDTSHVIVKLGEAVTCTITNTDNPPTLKLVKNVVNDDGGTAQPHDYALTAAAAGNPLTRNFTDFGDSTTFHNVNNGSSYALSESPNPGTGYSTNGIWVCTGNSTAMPDTSHVIVKLGEAVTCTITNTDNPPGLKLVKSVINNDGGTAVPHDYSLTAAAAGNPLSRNFSDFGDSTTFHTVSNGSSYALSESPNPGAGYSTTGIWVCTGNGTTMPDTSHVIVGLGETVTCTITNTDNPPTLKLVKNVINNDGGTAVAHDYALTAAAAGNPLTRNFTDFGDSTTFHNVNNLSSYALSESPNPGSGYSSDGIWVCTGNSTAMPDTSHVIVKLGEAVTCTITNTDNTPQLKLVKVVDNNDGGTAGPNDFTLSATAGAPNNGRNFSNAGGSGVFNNVFANAGYSLSETAVTGYTAGTWSCDGGQLSGGSTITLPLGAQVTCTIHNTDNGPQLKLVKVVDNNDGGTAGPNDFTLSAAAGAPNNTRNFSNAGGSGVFQSVFANAGYVLSETSVPGYSAGSWSCDGGNLAGSTITLPLGAQVTCTIHNTDNPPQLKLVKNVINNNNGPGVPNNWTLAAAAGTPNDGRNFSNLGGSGVFNNVFAGVQYTLTESPDPGAGYTDLGWNCTGGGTFTAPNKISVPLGAQVTCTVTNDDLPAALQLIKVVRNDNGGTAGVSAFAISTNANGGASLGFDAGSVNGNDTTFTSLKLTGLSAGNKTLHEGSVGGYTNGTWACINRADSTIHAVVSSNSNTGSVGLANGDDVICTILNDDIPGTIIIQKITDPANSPTSFSFDANGTGYVDFSLTGQSGSNTNTQQLNAGTYSVTEINLPAGWVLTGIGDPANGSNCVRTVTGSGTSTGSGNLATLTATINLGIGDTIRCTFEDTAPLVTRTQGFWATHPQLAQIAWFGGTGFGHTFPGVANTPGIGDISLCQRQIDSLAKLMGGFWGDISKDCNGGRRSKTDQSRMQLLQQLLAAELNASAFGSVPAQGVGAFAQWETAFCTGVNTQTAQSQAATFNTSGDNGTFTPGTSADAKYAKTIADTCFWSSPAGFARPIEQDKTVILSRSDLFLKPE